MEQQRIECVSSFVRSYDEWVELLDVEDSFTALGRNVARPIAGRAKLIVGLIGECWRCVCLGDELEEVGDDAEEQEVNVSVEALRTGDVGIGRAFAAARRAAVAAARGLIGGIIGVGPFGGA